MGLRLGHSLGDSMARFYVVNNILLSAGDVGIDEQSNIIGDDLLGNVELVDDISTDEVGYSSPGS